MQAKSACFRAWRALLATSAVGRARYSRLPLSKTPEGAILASNHWESEECRLMAVIGGGLGVRVAALRALA
jgi:hypothetical protein